jgi:hypothetical protein
MYYYSKIYLFIYFSKESFFQCSPDKKDRSCLATNFNLKFIAFLPIKHNDNFAKKNLSSCHTQSLSFEFSSCWIFGPPAQPIFLSFLMCASPLFTDFEPFVLQSSRHQPTSPLTRHYRWNRSSSHQPKSSPTRHRPISLQISISSLSRICPYIWSIRPWFLLRHIWFWSGLELVEIGGTNGEDMFPVKTV